MSYKHILLVTISNKPELIFFHIVKWFQVFLSNTNNSIYYYTFVSTKLNGFKYCYATVTTVIE